MNGLVTIKVVLINAPLTAARYVNGLNGGNFLTRMGLWGGGTCAAKEMAVEWLAVA